MLLSTALLGAGCGGGDDSGSERAVEWGLAPPVGPNWIRVSAAIEACIYDQPLLEAPIIEYEDDRVYIELGHTPEDDLGGCFLNLLVASKKITFVRNLDELVLLMFFHWFGFKPSTLPTYFLPFRASSRGKTPGKRLTAFRSFS
jgi:hypothetical protein